MCVLLLCAVVVGGSRMMPFATVREDAVVTSDVSLAPDAQEQASDVSARLLERADYNESWLQAATDWDRLGDVKRRHQVLITPDGRLTGRITAFTDWRGQVGTLARTTVHLLQNGQVAAQSTTDAAGRFIAEGLREGTYALIAQSPEGLVAFALHLRRAETDAEAATFELTSMAATEWDSDAVIQRVWDYWQAGPLVERTREPDAHTIPDAVRPIRQEGIAATTLRNHQVHLQDDGRLIGRLRRLHPDTGRPIVAKGLEVALYRNGSLQGLTWTDEIGYFEFPRVAPGVYSLVATGAESVDPTSRIMPESDRGLKHGFLALGIHVLPAFESNIVRVHFEDDPELEIDAAVVDVADLLPFLGDPVFLDRAETEEAAPFTNTANPLGNGSPGSGGGSSGAAGGNGLDGLLGAAAGGALSLLAADEGVISNAQP